MFRAKVFQVLVPDVKVLVPDVRVLVPDGKVLVSDVTSIRLYVETKLYIVGSFEFLVNSPFNTNSNIFVTI